MLEVVFPEMDLGLLDVTVDPVPAPGGETVRCLVDVVPGKKALIPESSLRDGSDSGDVAEGVADHRVLAFLSGVSEQSINNPWRPAKSLCFPSVEAGVPEVLASRNALLPPGSCVLNGGNLTPVSRRFV